MHKISRYLFGMLAILSLAGCAQVNKEAGNSDELLVWQKHADEKIELDWYINFSWYTTPWGGNVVSEAITEETGVDVNFVVPMGNETEKLSSMMASDTLPDLITLGWWEGQLQELIDKDMVYPLNELADKYDPYFYQVANEEIVKWYTKEDGNLYCYPNSFYTPQDFEGENNIGSNQNFLVQKEIYEAIGSPDMTTPEGFMDAIRKAAEMFPEIDGEPMIPIGADEFTDIGCNSFDKYLMNFLAIPFEKDGKFYNRYADPEYIKWLKVFRQLYEEGYLLDEVFVDKRVQLEEKMKSGRYFCLFYQSTDMEDAQKTLYSTHPERVYIAVDGPKNSNGDNPVLPNSGINGWTVTLISKNCKDPERAMAFLNYMISEEGQKKVYLGVEGETYDIIDGNYVLKPEVSTLLETDRDAFNAKYGAANAYWMLQNTVMQEKWLNLNQSIKDLKDWTVPYTVYTGQYDIVFEAGTEMADVKSRLEYEWSKTLPRLLMAETEEAFDSIYKEWQQTADQTGMRQYLNAATAEMKKLKEKMGME